MEQPRVQGWGLIDSESKGVSQKKMQLPKDKSSCSKIIKELKAEQARYSTSAPWANWQRSPYTHLPFSLKLRQYSVLNLGTKFVKGCDWRVAGNGDGF